MKCASTPSAIALAALLGVLPAQAQVSDFSQIHPIYESIDRRMGSGARQLMTARERSADDFDLETGQSSTFGDAITREIMRHLESGQVYFKGYHQYGKTPKRPDPQQASLTSHPLCIENRASLERSLRRPQQLLEREIELVNAFARKANAARRRYRANPQERQDVIRVWAALAGCLAYTESLGDPDTKASRRRAAQLLGAGYRKPAGVKFYYDRRHSNPASRWNIGLYQFVLSRGGNINPCIRSWVAGGFPTSRRIHDLELRQMGAFVGSPGQSFNAFCGVNKLAQTIFVNAHTTDRDLTHAGNRVGPDRLRPPEDRCVSLHNKSAYSHFGPLIRTDTSVSGYHSNLEKLFSCARHALRE